MRELRNAEHLIQDEKWIRIETSFAYDTAICLFAYRIGSLEEFNFLTEEQECMNLFSDLSKVKTSLHTIFASDTTIPGKSIKLDALKSDFWKHTLAQLKQDSLRYGRADQNPLYEYYILNKDSQK